ncbi:hypothetical protein CEXT_792811 [Caerostris extrusa]|uniref:Uncharacterized protein n=1 Tax=Caerostris extrusa TaxID=172846 RepID=A0AAV4MK35_CAEEX|nr:hypothetical protein CEXT_792811 [Caerostris extrusa]
MRDDLSLYSNGILSPYPSHALVLRSIKPNNNEQCEEYKVSKSLLPRQLEMSIEFEAWWRRSQFAVKAIVYIIIAEEILRQMQRGC